MKSHQTFRRPKETPCADFWHTIRIGLAIFVALIIGLPLVFNLIH